MIVRKGVKALVSILALRAYQLAIGIGTTPAWTTNETLENEKARADATVSITSINFEGDTLKLEAMFTMTERLSITEYGVFDKGTGMMIARYVANPIEVPVGTNLKVIYYITGKIG